MTKYLMAFLWALPFLFLYYVLNDNAFYNIQNDLNERFSFEVNGKLDKYAIIYLISDYMIINLTSLGFFAALNRTKTLSKRSIAIVSLVSTSWIIFCHTFLLQLDLIASYYTITCALSIFTFIYMLKNRKGSLVGNFLLSMTSFALYLFIAFIHFIYIYYNLHTIIEDVREQDSLTLNLIQDSIDKNNFEEFSKKHNIHYNIETNTITLLSQLKNNQNSRINTGIINMISDLEHYNSWSNSFTDIEKDKIVKKNHKVIKVTKSNNTYTIKTYSFEFKLIQDLYGQFFMVIYFSILGFLSVWLSGVFKLMIIHSKIKIK